MYSLRLLWYLHLHECNINKLSMHKQVLLKLDLWRRTSQITSWVLMSNASAHLNSISLPGFFIVLTFATETQLNCFIYLRYFILQMVKNVNILINKRIAQLPSNFQPGGHLQVSPEPLKCHLITHGGEIVSGWVCQVSFCQIQ